MADYNTSHVPHGIPTAYNGVKFRSRLEARWAAFFDLVGWRWDYEPVDFDGWIPDFVLIGEKQVTFVEVKPVFRFPQEAADKIEASGCEEEALIVGAGNPIKAGAACGPGWLADHEFWGRWHWGVAEYHRWSTGIGFSHETGWYGDRISGEGHKSIVESGYGGDIDLDITALWRNAGNHTQWRKGDLTHISRVVWS